MKFAKQLERDAVPEWRIKYLNYKAGKKYVKAVARAAQRANATPQSFGNPETTPSFYTARSGARPTPSDRYRDAHHGDETNAFLERRTSVGGERGQISSSARPIEISGQAATSSGSRGEQEALTGSPQPHYGSFVPTPPFQTPNETRKADKNPFELPAPALHPSPSEDEAEPKSHRVRDSFSHLLGRRSASASVLPTVGASKNGGPSGQGLQKLGSASNFKQSPSQLKRMFSHSGGLGSRYYSKSTIGTQGLNPVREREADFYAFLDSELIKVEAFYKLKENQAGDRLALLREQLREMRNRRLEEIAQSKQNSDGAVGGDRRDGDHDTKSLFSPIKAKFFPPGPNSQAFGDMARTPHLAGNDSGDSRRDYIRRPGSHEVPYRTAKRKLKLALQEFYRGLELLKSYALLNRTAFRKLNKKFDKAVNARPPYRYMNEKVSKAWFVTSDVLEGHIKAVEDLYARYFERGNHKLAAGKLRSLTKKHGDHGGSSFINGFCLGTGFVFTVQGMISAVQLLSNDDNAVRVDTSYLLQIYGGYFLMLLLLGLFCIDCAIWTGHKINYPFIFELDQRHQLDWRRMAEFPCFFFLVFGLLLWANFSTYIPEYMFLYMPTILIGVTTLIIFLPFPVFSYRTRKWFLYSHYRLLLAGLYPVEFRDFFLGDMYCSLTYATANVELFFCLYSNGWNNPAQCNSNHSRAMGFLTALPPIWRFLQCIRRYKDTRNIFPHLVNCGKYTMSIMAAMALSIYRINGTHSNMALFVTFSLINSVYCSVWDLFMDFSLLQTGTRHFALRDILAFKRRWPYYTIMVVDPVIRFAWIFYAIFTHDKQHSTIVSFLVSLVEVLRRGSWALFRVENEHCANVAQYKASRDVPLPYRMEPLLDRASAESSPVLRDQNEQQEVEDEEAGQGIVTASSTAVANSMGTLGALRRRADTVSARSFSKILAEAHKQDFEKKRRPAVQGAVEGHDRMEASDDDDDDDDDDNASMLEVAEAEELRLHGAGES